MAIGIAIDKRMLVNGEPLSLQTKVYHKPLKILLTLLIKTI